MGAERAWAAGPRPPDAGAVAQRHDQRQRPLGLGRLGLRASYALGESLGPARLGGTLGASWTEFPDCRVILPVPGGRQDERVFGRLEAVFEDSSFAGFAPVVSLEAARTRSNVSRFDTESLGLGVTVRSAFQGWRGSRRPLGSAPGTGMPRKTVKGGKAA